ncbi:MAG: hypothetical protein GXP13_08960 [Gammaproteobacteria bacterium]|nr:hypothetical protein [Gammaproteobacteria bacterium]
MKRILLSLVIPPFSVCRYGCAGCCAAPIGVFWVAGIASLVYGYLGGPLNLEGISWNTIGLGALLWGIASVWAIITVVNIGNEVCEKKSDSFCRNTDSRLDESDPMDEVRKAR